MIGCLYLLLNFVTGWAICSLAFPGLAKLTETDFYKRKITVSPYLLLLPAWYVIGTLAMTWPVYLLAYAFRSQDQPLFYANLIVMPLALFVSGLVVFLKFNKAKTAVPVLFVKDRRVILLEIVLLTAVTLLAAVLMWRTFFVEGDKLYIGVSVFSDFSPHVGMIRSFSYGNNFPTTYPHYAGEDIKYHFMFQFLAGNLEFLGLRIDYAFNIPSMLSFIGAFLMLYLIAVKITGKIGAGFLACMFFAFRSAKTLFTYLSQIPKGNSILKALTENTGFIGDTPNEEWGLWNLNVYCNQRHLAFGLTAVFLVILLFLPYLFEMFEELKQLHFIKADKKNYRTSLMSKLSDRIKILFFHKECWMVKDIRQSIATGILLGSLSFFHGAAVIGVLCVLFLMAILSRRRLEYLITALIAVALSLLQTRLFIDGSAVTTKFFFGFIAENKTIFGAASYLERLLGILPFVLLAAFCLEKGVGRYLILAFSAPLIFAFTISLTVDVTVNHKYIMMSCILLGIFAASLIMKLLEHRDFLLKLIGFVLILMLTATGIYDFTTVLKKNTPDSSIVLNLKDPLTEWINENSRSQDIFLTNPYTINQVVLGGAMLFEGWPYYPWSAGYDTFLRTDQVRQMYEAQSPKVLDTLIKHNGIRFIIVDSDTRNSEDFALNEANIASTYDCVYQQGDGEAMLSIYDTTKPVY